MEKNTAVTVIDNETMRGVIAPATVLSKEMLEGIVDFIELSDRASQQETTERIEEADKDASWIPLKEIRTRIDKAE